MFRFEHAGNNYVYVMHSEVQCLILATVAFLLTQFPWNHSFETYCIYRYSVGQSSKLMNIMKYSCRNAILVLTNCFLYCQNCRASDKYAVSICFSAECASYNGNHPIRYCQQCHNIRHNNRRGGDHIVHTSLPQLWDMDAEVQTYMVESIVRYSILNHTVQCP